MRNLIDFGSDKFTAATVCCVLGAFFLILNLTFPAARNSAFLISFLIAVFVGLSSRKSKDAIKGLLMFIIGTVVGLILLSLLKVITSGSASGLALVLPMLKVVLITDLFAAAMWLPGIPAGLWLRKFT